MRIFLLTWMFCAASALTAQTNGTLIVVNQKQHAVDLVDPTGGKLLTAINVGVNGHEIVLSKDGRLAYVPIYSNVGVGKPGTNGQFIDVIDLKQAKVIKSIDLGHPVRPHKPLFGPDGLLYVSAELDNAIDIVNPKTDKVVGQIPTGAPQSHVFGISPDGRHAYTANVGDGSMSVLDLKTRKLLKVIPLTKTVQRVAISNDNRWVFTSDWDNPRVAVIDAQTNTLSRWIPTEGTPYVTQPTPDGRYLLVGHPHAGLGRDQHDRARAEVGDLVAEVGRRLAGTEADALWQGVVDEAHAPHLPLPVPLPARQVAESVAWRLLRLGNAVRS